MNITGYSKSHSYMIDLLLQQKAAMEEKSIQTATGQKAPTYGGIGVTDTRLALSMRREISEIEVYEGANAISDVQLTLMNQTLEQLEEMRRESVSAIDNNNYTLTTGGQTTSQQATGIMLREVVSQLNTEVNGYYLYGGADATDTPVASFETLMNGGDGKLGLKQLMNRYEGAHLGVGENGRISLSTVAPAGVPTVTLQKDNTAGFGFDIASVSSSSANITSTLVPEDLSVPGSPVPQQASFAFADVPAVGETVEVELRLPDGRTSIVKLTATDKADAGEGTFLVGTGADPIQETADHLNSALQEKLSKLAKTELRASADVQAGSEFFGTHGRADPAAKVPLADGSGYETADDLVVQWYTGTSNADDPRQDKVVRIDDNVSIAYGARANESAFTELLQNMAVFVAADFIAADEGDPDSVDFAKSYYGSLAKLTDKELSYSGDRNSGVQTVAGEMSVIYTQLKHTSERQEQTKLSYKDLLQKAEGYDKTQAATELKILDENLQVSFAATAKLLSLSIANYL